MPNPDKLDTLLTEAFGKYPKAKKLAVENFCFSAPDDKVANKLNLAADSRSYPWNADTVNAIRFVLKGVNKL